MSAANRIEGLVSGLAQLVGRLRDDAAAWDRDVAERTLRAFEAAHGLGPTPAAAPATLTERLRPSGRPLLVHHGDDRHAADRALLAGWAGGVRDAVDVVAVRWADGGPPTPGLAEVRADLTRAEAEARLGHPGDALPETVLIDRDGGLLARSVGPLDAAALERLAQLVGGSS